MEALRDSWGREIHSVRVSVTDKCNFRCKYCMPAEGLEWLPRDEVLSYEEIARIVRVLAAMGVCEVRLTGGEPLVRRELPVLISLLSEIPGVDDLSLTTNGVLLDRLAQPLVDAGQGRELRHEPREVAPHERLAAGQPHVAHAHLGEQPDEPRDLLEREDPVALQPRQPLRRHAVLAAEVAAVGDGDAHVADRPAVAVAQGLAHGTSVPAAARRAIRCPA